MLSGLKKELVEYVINEGEKCPKCGVKLKVIGKENFVLRLNFYRQN